MYKIVKSDRVQLSDTSYVMKEPRRSVSTAALAAGGQQDDPQADTLAPLQTEEDLQPPESNAQREALLEQAHRQAEMIVRDAAQRAQEEYAAVLERARVEAEQLREQAIQEGRSTGARSQMDAVRACIADVEQAISSLEGDQAGFMVEYEQKLKWFALEIASNIMHKRIQTDDAEMAELVKGAVSTVSGAKWISVEISNQMPKLLDLLTQTLQAAQAGGKIEVRPVNAPHGTCLVDTPEGIVDASLYTQLDNLKEYFSAQG